MQVPFSRPSVGDNEIAAVTRVLRSGWLTTGPVVAEFEAAVAARTGVAHGVALSSCTAALHLALEALGVRPGDLVLVPTLTFAATAEVVRYVGATPVFVDSDASRSMDPVALRDTLVALEAARAVPGVPEPRGVPRAVIVVHFGGRIGNIEAILDTAREFGLRVVEDAAHAFGAALATDERPEGRRAGAWGDAGCFSFYANKGVTTGEGGMLVTDDDAVAARVRLLSNHGIDRAAWNRRDEDAWRYDIVAPGFKYNMSDIAASIGIAQLAQCDAMQAERERISAAYRDRLGAVEGLRLPSPDTARSRSTWHLFQIMMEPGRWRITRNELMLELERAGIACAVHYEPLHLHTYYRERFGFGRGMFPTAEYLADTSISLPIFSGLTDAELDHVVRALSREADAFVDSRA